jgi:hypothetical protein
MSLEREWHKETVDSTRKISELSMVIGWMNTLEFAHFSQALYPTAFTFPSNFTVRMKEESADWFQLYSVLSWTFIKMN